MRPVEWSQIHTRTLFTNTSFTLNFYICIRSCWGSITRNLLNGITLRIKELLLNMYNKLMQIWTWNSTWTLPMVYFAWYLPDHRALCEARTYIRPPGRGYFTTSIIIRRRGCSQGHRLWQIGVISTIYSLRFRDHFRQKYFLTWEPTSWAAISFAQPRDLMARLPGISTGWRHLRFISVDDLNL